ncbi:chemotaxis transducer [Vibrio sp. MACH09]|uniref:methyl-accepting chemotaxis protein n=1 Tax=Vibrio sp. MACH09 TaxID=3025122 RepID=UPI002794D24B|nr:methyl-accepting chemotaxis protein [Vibrio sp. MACH09]GLO63399.1 chemotaxis transducer [Vibrio sp. MACH09]
MKFNTIQGRIGLYIFLCSMVISIVLVMTSLFSSERTLELTTKSSEKLVVSLTEASVKSDAKRVAGMVSNELKSAQNYLDSLTLSFESIKQEQSVGGIGPMEIRQLLNNMLVQSLKSDSSYIALYSVWQPNMLGGADKIFRHQPGHNKAGRFAPYWHYQAGDVAVTALDNFDDETSSSSGSRIGEYYLCPQERGTACFLKPYKNHDNGGQLVSSISSPIMIEDKFYGVVGIDMDMRFLDKVAKKVAGELFDGSGIITILTETGFVLGGSEQKEVGDSEDDQSILSQLNRGETNISIADGVITASSPIKIEQLGINWSIVYQISEAVVYRDIEQLEASIIAENDSARTEQIIVALIVTLLCVTLTYLLAGKIVKPIHQAVELLSKVAKGDLSVRTDPKTNDETRLLINACNEFLNKTQPVIKDVAMSSNQLLETSNAISSGAIENRQRLDEQQTSLQLLAAASEEMASTSEELAEIASNSSSSAEKSIKAIKSSIGTMGQLNDVTDQLSMEVSSTNQIVSELSENSKQVFGVISVIQGIAEQTNLLALNAAIEAARAGEQGRGFAVVADEVRSLAQRTQESTGQIGSILETLQTESNKAANAMHMSLEKVQLNKEQVDEVTAALDSIHQSVDTITGLNMQVATAAQQQNAVAKEVSEGVNNVSQTATHIAKESEQTESWSEMLTQLSGSLSKSVSVFKV